MKILVIGGGGREHALCWAIKKSRPDAQIFCAPGNAGIAEIARCVQISPTAIADLTKFAIEQAIDLIVVGGENSLAAGIVNHFEMHQLKIVGPNLAASRLESSKVFAKQFMFRHNIPTARFQACESIDEAVGILKRGEFGDENSSVVVKADGLAAGKGVVVAQNRAEAVKAIEDLMGENNAASGAASRIVLEETLVGSEISLLLFSDGRNYALMPPARDHKRIGEGDTGANTGGMGTITDESLLTGEELKRIVTKIVEPTLAGALAEGFPFRGILFLGLMINQGKANLLEYNVRFGDPEAQSILVRLESNFVDICESIVDGKLDSTQIEFDHNSSACVIMAAEGYPAQPKTGDTINGLEKAIKHKDVVVFHSGTKKSDNNKILTAGGRVLGVTASAMTLSDALEKSYGAIGEISWDGAQFRRDIGRINLR